MELLGFQLCESGSEGRPDSPPPLAAARERSPPPSPADGSGDEDELPEYLARLGAWRLEDDEGEEDELSARMRQLSLVARQRAAAAASESDEEPAEINIFAFFQEATEEEPAARLFRRLHRLLPIRLCRSTLAECAGDWLAAHWRLRQHVAALLAISLPPERPEYEAHVDACWEEGRSAEQQQLAQLQLEEDGLQRRRVAAVRQGRRPAVQQADQQLAELQQQRLSIQEEACNAILQRVNQWSISLETVDVHAQRPSDAKRIAAQVVQHNTTHWPPYRHGRHMVVFITGRGNRSGPAGIQVKPAVEQELERHGISFRDDNSAVCAFFNPPPNT